MNHRNTTAFTWTETLVCLTVFATLTFVLLPIIGCGPKKSSVAAVDQLPQALENLKQLHHATEQMVIDGVMKANTNLNWPGNTGGSFSNWAAILVPAYLSTNDFAKLLSGGGITLPPDQLPLTNNSAVLVYAVTEDATNTTVLLSTANFTNTPDGGLPLGPTPYADKGFAIVRKDGSGAIFHQTGPAFTNTIGPAAPLCQ